MSFCWFIIFSIVFPNSSLFLILWKFFTKSLEASCFVFAFKAWLRTKPQKPEGRMQLIFFVRHTRKNPLFPHFHYVINLPYINTSFGLFHSGNGVFRGVLWPCRSIFFTRGVRGEILKPIHYLLFYSELNHYTTNNSCFFPHRLSPITTSLITDIENESNKYHEEWRNMNEILIDLQSYRRELNDIMSRLLEDLSHTPSDVG